VCGAFGAITYSCCLKCLAEGREPYRNIVDYIAAAGRWPEDINATYQQEVRYQLILHEKSEERFKFDVEQTIAEELGFMKDQAFTFKIPKEDF
jgi:hypothetical protein